MWHLVKNLSVRQSLERMETANRMAHEDSELPLPRILTSAIFPGTVA